MITGGILLFYVGFEMLQSKKSKIHHQEHLELDDDIAVSPLAIPILAGPGTIFTAMNNVTNGCYIHIAIVVVIFALMIYLTYTSCDNEWAINCGKWYYLAFFTKRPDRQKNR